MWFPFWRSKDGFTLDELRYLTDQLMKIQVVNDVNKDFVIEALRSIAELITYGDQHDTKFFEFFMEKQVMGEFEEIVSFPLYVEAIRFAFHEEGMIRTAVRALTLNIYHVGDVYVNKYIASSPQNDYFLNFVKFFTEHCISLNEMVSPTTESEDPKSSSSSILSAVDEIEDNLYYLSDVVSVGIPDIGTLITDSMLKFLIFPLLLPSLRIEVYHGKKLSSVTCLYLLCCILRILKIKDLSNTVAAALICSSSGQHNCYGSASVLRDALICYITSGDDMQVVGSLSVLATFLQTKELDESMVDALGILPQRKQHKKLLLKALVGEESGEEQLFASENWTSKDTDGELSIYLQRLKDQYEVSCSYQEVGESPRVHRFLVLDGLISLFCRTNISADTLWDGGWLLRQLLPYSETEFNTHHLQSLKDSFKKCCSQLQDEQRGSWHTSDM